MAQGDGYHNTIYGADYLHLPLNFPFHAAENFELRGDGFVERTAGPVVPHNATPIEPNQVEGREDALQQNAQNEDPIQPVVLVLPREPLAQPHDFFLLYDYETEESEQEESDLEDSDFEGDDGENQENDMDPASWDSWARSLFENGKIWTVRIREEDEETYKFVQEQSPAKNIYFVEMCKDMNWQTAIIL